MIIPAFDELKTLVKSSGLPLSYIAYRSGVRKQTIVWWLTGLTQCPRIDTMTKIATVLGQHIELTERVGKMVSYYPKQTIRPAPPIPFKGMTRHAVRMTMLKLQ
jgi:hypothetical protein